MAPCEACGNDYPLSFEIHTVSGVRQVFNCFGCAIHRLAPVYEQCGRRILTRGMGVARYLFRYSSCAGTNGLASAARAADSGGAG